MKKIDKPIYVNLGRQIKQARINKGYSLSQVANMVGKSKVTIKRYEDAISRIDMETLEKIANVLGMNVMDAEVFLDGSLQHKIGLYPKFEEMIKYDKELQDSGVYWENIVFRASRNFAHLDSNLQKSILIMLQFDEDEIKEILSFLH